jgi:hypothetical protein
MTRALLGSMVRKKNCDGPRFAFASSIFLRCAYSHLAAPFPAKGDDQEAAFP